MHRLDAGTGEGVQDRAHQRVVLRFLPANTVGSVMVVPAAVMIV